MAKQTLTVTLYASELKYDVQNGTYLTGRSRRTESNGGNDEEVAHMIANDDEESINNILRSIGSAFGELKNKLSEYLTDETTTTSDKLIKETDDLVITLLMPNNYNLATKEAVSAAAHDYIVNMATGKWFVITNKTDAKDYFDLAENNITTIKQAISKRVRPVRPEFA